MAKIVRGTTPSIIIKLPDGLDTSDVAELWLTISQHGRQIINKTLDDLTPGETGFELHLTQADTLKICADVIAVQARLRTVTGDAIATDIYSVSAGRILKDGVI